MQPGSKEREHRSEGSPVTICKPGFARGAQSAPQDARLAPAGADPPACACTCVTCLATCVHRAARKAAEEAARKAEEEEAVRHAAEEAARKAAEEEAADLRRRLEVAHKDAQQHPPAHWPDGGRAPFATQISFIDSDGGMYPSQGNAPRPWWSHHTLRPSFAASPRLRSRSRDRPHCQLGGPAGCIPESQPGSKQRECPSEGSPVTVCKPGFARAVQSAPQYARLAPAGADPPACACVRNACAAASLRRAARKAAEEAARKAAVEAARKAAAEEAARRAATEDAAQKAAAEEAVRKAAAEEAADLRRRLEVALTRKYTRRHTGPTEGGLLLYTH